MAKRFPMAEKQFYRDMLLVLPAITALFASILVVIARYFNWEGMEMLFSLVMLSVIYYPLYLPFALIWYLWLRRTNSKKRVWIMMLMPPVFAFCTGFFYLLAVMIGYINIGVFYLLFKISRKKGWIIADEPKVSVA